MRLIDVDVLRKSLARLWKDSLPTDVPLFIDGVLQTTERSDIIMEITQLVEKQEIIKED